MSKKRIRLTENDLHRIVNESVVRILKEYNNLNMFDDILTLSNGCAIVSINDRYNVIDKDGNLLSDKWFDDPIVARQTILGK